MKVLTLVLGCLLLCVTANAAFINCPGPGGVWNTFPNGSGAGSTATCAQYDVANPANYHIAQIDLRYRADYTGGGDSPNSITVTFTNLAGFTSPVTLTVNGGISSTGYAEQIISLTGLNLFSFPSFVVSEAPALLTGTVDASSARVDIQFTEAYNVPEPATIAMLGGGLLAFGALVRRRRKA